VARPFNAYGPRQSARAVIPTILAQLHSGASDIRLGRTAPTRDFTFVEDIVSGILAVARCDRAIGEVVNIGSAREISIGDLARLLVRISGREAAIVADDRRLRPPRSEVDRLLCDNSRIRDWTGWQPRYSLERGLQITSDWVRNNLERFEVAGYTV
jgi:nucleoside-diphosphate-sugar epimerase